MYPSTSLFIAVGQLAIVVLVLFSYPLQVHPCRNCLDKVFHPSHPPAKVITADDGEDDGEEVDDEFAPVDMSPLKHTLLTSAIIAGGFTIAYIVDDLKMGECELPMARDGVADVGVKCSRLLVLLDQQRYLSFFPDYSIGR
jgi:Transmembrane amino acid transporter protein